MCCKRRLIKKRIKVPKRSGQPMRHDPLKEGNLPKSQAAISPAKNIINHTTMKERISSTVGGLFKKSRSKSTREDKVEYYKSTEYLYLLQKKKVEATQEEELDSDENKPDVVRMTDVKCLGNLDEIIKDRKLNVQKAIEEIKSTHEMEDLKSQQSAVIDPQLHVKIAEKKCVLYETNDEPTLDDELSGMMF
ncbi:unnamed protein product [Onchocerca flexuosa]|uniref:Uncharacterized protein n=1 Tax=Onchocerca flexuosa TaxID=387005 RepID=A0A183H7K3_9BILA|nr:unnamed protein product [Onchocerca flexuosa]